MVKTYSRIDWENEPSTKTPVNETNLNKMDAALNEIDNRVVSLDTTKASVSDVNGLVASIEFNEKTGVFTVTKKDGSKATFDTKLEKIAVNFEYDAATQKIIIYLDDGTTQEIDLSAFVTQYEFTDGDIVTWSVVGGKVTANIKENSIPGNKLEPNYLANCITAKNEAQTAAASASNDAKRAEDAAERAEGIVGITIATTEKAGIVKPDGKSISVKADGTITANYSNPNLLDNPFFTVNQREQSEYVGAVYGVDRWKGIYGSEKVKPLVNGGIELTVAQNQGIRQILDTQTINALRGKTVTLTVDVSGDITPTSYLNILCGDGVNIFGLILAHYNAKSATFTIPSDVTNINIDISGNTIAIIHSIKLELGSASTLEYDTTPNYSEEYIKCCTSKADASDEYANQKINFGSNPNLLDNPFFTINQRGLTELHVELSRTAYGHDRWYMVGSENDTCELHNGYVKLISTYLDRVPIYSQTIATGESLKGKTITVSGDFFDCIKKEGSVTAAYGFIRIAYYSNSEYIKDDYVFILNNGISSLSFIVPSECNEIVVQVTAYWHCDISCKSVKIELGTVSTLELDVAPNYAEELAKCQRYYTNYKLSGGTALGAGYAASSTSVRIGITTPVSMRTSPVVTCANPSNFFVVGGGKSLTPTAIIFKAYSNNIATVECVVSGATVNECYALRYNANDNLELLADL